MIIVGTSSIAGTTIALKLVETAIALVQKHLETLPEEELTPGTKAFKTDINNHLETVTEEEGDIQNNPGGRGRGYSPKTGCTGTAGRGYSCGRGCGRGGHRGSTGFPFPNSGRACNVCGKWHSGDQPEDSCYARDVDAEMTVLRELASKKEEAQARTAARKEQEQHAHTVSFTVNKTDDEYKLSFSLWDPSHIIPADAYSTI
eukprot:1183813-Rhodomonas_salina.1